MILGWQVFTYGDVGGYSYGPDHVGMFEWIAMALFAGALTFGGLASILGRAEATQG